MLISELNEGFFSTSEEDLAKAPPGDPAGDYYKKLISLKTNPQWAGKESIIQKRIEDLLNRINLDKGLPVNAQGKAEPETDFDKFRTKNPNFNEAGQPAPTQPTAPTAPKAPTAPTQPTPGQTTAPTQQTPDAKPPATNLPAATAPTQQTPDAKPTPIPAMPDISGLQAGGEGKDLDGGERVKIGADGNVQYMGAWGTYVYNPKGQYINTISPRVGGFQQTTNPQGQVTSQNYNQGDLDVTQGPQGTQATYQMGADKLTQQIQENVELSRIKSLTSKLLKG